MSFGDFDVPSFDTDFELDTSVFANGKDGLSLQQPDLESPKNSGAHISSPDAKLPKPPSSLRIKKRLLMERPRSWLVHGSKTSKNSSPSTEEKIPTSPSAEIHPMQSSPTRPERSLARSESFATFAKRSWISRSSRSPSPKSAPDQSIEQIPKEDSDEIQSPAEKPTKRPHRLHIITNHDQVDDSKAGSKAFNLATSYLSKMKPKQQSNFNIRDGLDSDHSCASSATSLNRTSDSIRTSASHSMCSDGNTNTPTTDESGSEMVPKIRDPLWSTFKSLDIEAKGFKQGTAQRVTQVQTVLLPFLKNTNDHPSMNVISLEDVERRAVVLNKWWTVLLDMLQGQTQQHIPGMDRPILLEAAIMLMMRPEWRQSAPDQKTASDQLPAEQLRSRSWTDASRSTADSFTHFEMLAESAEHNIRTMFVSNLVRQMAYVVEKMSLRHAPLNLVSFSGKTCAYAFFFAPGVADVLVRLWGLTPELIRRVGTELGLPRKERRESDDIVARFPERLAGFAWSSPRAVWDSLKQIPKMPLPVARIPWTGPWVARWKGRDTDLFFIFCKYFHILCDQFLPPGLPLTEKARSPAFALVHAQILSIIDSTIHRQMGMDHSITAPLVDSVMAPDAPAMAAMPLAHTNMLKTMGENRLVVLLKDFLSDVLVHQSGARHTFAETFAILIKAAARKTSLYDNATCATLCDFLEEVLMIYHDFETTPTSYVDWPFWIEVCKRMSSSMNTMTEVRMLSFIFTVWDAIAQDTRRKVNVCLEWLLTEQTFNTFFNNWCPMVRAYYQRLICWRMCRYTGGSNEMDLNIYCAAAARLESQWAHFLYLKQDAEACGRTPPSTAPMSPVMGKKFMIIRQEINTPQRGLFMGFDSFARLPPHSMQVGDDTPDTSGLARPDSNKKRWSLIEKVLSMTSSSPLQSPSDELPRSISDPSGLGREAVDPAGTRPVLVTNKSAISDDGSLGSPTVFDEQKHIFKFILGWQQNHGPARERALTRPRLPLPTEARISTHSRTARTPLPRSAAQSPPETPRPLMPRTDTGSSPSSASVEAWLRNTPTSGTESQDRDDELSVNSERSRSDISNGPPFVLDLVDGQDQFTKPLKPSGIYAKNAVYCGRALAEWSQVVSECNIFTERRQDDGILRLCDVEVPLLKLEGFRKLGI